MWIIRVLQAIVKSLVFALGKIGRYCQIMGENVIGSDLSFERIIIFAVMRLATKWQI